jgi:hypothetical protein
MSGDDDLFKDFLVEDLFEPEQRLASKRDTESGTLGYRYPIWFTACSHEKITYKLTSPGSKEKGSDYVRFAALATASRPELESHPQLKYLAGSVVKYLQNFHQHKLELEVQSHVCWDTIIIVLTHILMCHTCINTHHTCFETHTNDVV